jgi:hypothetical protein
MRASLRVPPRLRLSQPWWLALPLMLVWGVLTILFSICAGVWIVARFMTQRVQRGLRAWQARRAA